MSAAVAPWPVIYGLPIGITVSIPIVQSTTVTAPVTGSMSRLAASFKLTGFMGLTLPLMPVQHLLVRAGSMRARTFPHWYHRRVCRLLGVRIHQHGSVIRDRPVLLVANHVSWLDIPVVSAVAPVSFIAKKEVDSWPFVQWLARLQRTIFVDRQRRTKAGETANEMAVRLAAGDSLVLFAEGTSSDGNRVLPFLSTLFAATQTGAGLTAMDEAAVQFMSIAYVSHRGLPLGRAGRPLVAWYGDMEMKRHAWQLLQAGPIEVEIRIGDPVPLSAFSDRKDMARMSELAVRQQLTASLRGRPPGVAVQVADPAEVRLRARPRPGRRGDGSGHSGWV